MPTGTIQSVGTRRRGAGTHRSAGFSGSASLTNANAGNGLTPSNSTSLCTYGCWLKVDSLTSQYQKIMTLEGGSVSKDCVTLQIDSSNQLTCTVSNGSVYSTVTANFGGGVHVPTVGHWYLCLFGWGTGSTVYLSQWDLSGALTGGATGATGPVNNPSPAPGFYLGSGPAGGFPFTGEIDSAFAYPARLLTTAETNWLTNTGGSTTAKDYADMAANQSSLLTGLAGWWNLDEAAGSAVWKDASVNGRDLTAAGTVTSQNGAGF